MLNHHQGHKDHKDHFHAGLDPCRNRIKSTWESTDLSGHNPTWGRRHAYSDSKLRNNRIVVLLAMACALWGGRGLDGRGGAPESHYLS